MEKKLYTFLGAESILSKQLTQLVKKNTHLKKDRTK